MDTHTCLRCGLEASCSHGTWIDRHPVAVAVIAIAALLIVAAIPWLLVVGALGAVVYVVDRGYRRRRAPALRADWEHKTLIARPTGAPPALPEGLGLMTLPTVPLGMGRN